MAGISEDKSPVEEMRSSTMVKDPVEIPHICMVCGDRAKYSCYGAMACQSCKVFFRRNAQNRSIPLICLYGDHCEINVLNRRICTSCRLAKCFSVGMSKEMIRATRTKQIDKKSKALVKFFEGNKRENIRPLNLLERDHSLLNMDQWNLISNLVHSFDQYSECALIEQFVEEQVSLPPKYRFKYSTVKEFYRQMLINIQNVSEKNRNSISLSSDDRCLLLRSTIEYTTNIGGAFLLRQYHLLDYPDFLRSFELIFQPSAFIFIKRLIDQLDPDIQFLKIFFGLVSFLMSNYTVYHQTPFNHLKDMKKIIFIQDMYTELIWRYLISKHLFREAVLCFSNLIRCLFLLNHSIVEAHQAQQFTEIIDSVTQTMEQKLLLNC